jgi:hypothetical protein
MSRPFKIGDERFDLLNWDELTMGEQAEVQKLTGIRGAFALEQARAVADVNMTMAVVYISLRRSRPEREDGTPNVTWDEVSAHRTMDIVWVDKDGNPIDLEALPNDGDAGDEAAGEGDAGPPALTPATDGIGAGGTSSRPAFAT